MILLAPQAPSQYAIPWHSIDGGGWMQSTGGVYTVSGTIGQPDAGKHAMTPYKLIGGFWAIAIQQLGYPPLNITRAENDYTVLWETTEPGLILQQTTNLSTPTLWLDVGGMVTTNGLTNAVMQTIPTGVIKTFYRLRREL